MKSYEKSLLDLIKNLSNENIDNYLLINLYITLISLNSNIYNKKTEEEAINKVKLFLTKINNLKVKIQLNRKPKEIDELSKSIEKDYIINEESFNYYINSKEEFLNSISSNDAKKLTYYIDDITKKEIYIKDNIDSLFTFRNSFIKDVFNYNYDLKENIIYLNNKEYSLNEFKDNFNYLLNIENYSNLYKKVFNNTERQNLIKSTISFIKKEIIPKEDIERVLIPTILIYLLNKPNLNIISDDFIIENIKISELYALKESNINPKNIKVPDDYLINKIKEIMSKGMYYFDKDKFILELVNNKVSDFKVSITTENIKKIIINNLSN